MSIIANTKGQTLKDHLQGVRIRASQILDQYSFNKRIHEELAQAVAFSGLLHDLGKLSPDFQAYIASKKTTSIESHTDAEAERVRDVYKPVDAAKAFLGPYHNEISWAFISRYVDFENSNLSKLVFYAVYWHHPKNVDTKDLSAEDVWKRYLKNNNLKEEEEVARYQAYTQELAEAAGLGIKFRSSPSDAVAPVYEDFCNDDEKEFKLSCLKTVCLLTLIEADRQISAMSAVDLVSFLSNPVPLMEHYKVTAMIPRSETSERTIKQKALAQELAKNQISVCGADPGVGKTLIALLWAMSLDYKGKIIIALPKQVMVTGLFNNMEKNLKLACENYQDISVEGIFSGRVQHQCPENPGRDTTNLLQSDINIMVFDRFLSPNFERGQFSEFVTMLRSHLVLDEFHEFSNIHTMRYPLKKILQIRQWIQNGPKTLMLSGTPDIPLCQSLGIDTPFMYDRSRLDPVSRTKIKFNVIEGDTSLLGNGVKEDSIVALNKVEDAQVLHIKSRKHSIDSILCHSYFTNTDRKAIVDNIFKLFNGDDEGLNNKTSLHSAKMFMSSYDFNFNNGYVEVSLPSWDVQLIGRVNRFGNKASPEVNFLFSNSESMFQSNRHGFGSIYSRWKRHLKKVIQENPEMEYREFITKTYDDFFKVRENLDLYIDELKAQEQKACKELKDWYPKRNKKKTKKNGTVKSSSGFRGASFVASAKVVNDQGEVVGQLVDQDLLSVSEGWDYVALRDSNVQAQRKNAKGINAEIFDFSKYNVKPSSGRKVETPLLYSHVDEKVDQVIRDQLEDSKLHKVYNKTYGLISSSLMNEESGAEILPFKKAS